MKLTYQFIQSGRSKRGGWSRKQTQLLGVNGWPLRPGWLRDAIGREITDASANEFLRIKDLHVKAVRYLKIGPEEQHQRAKTTTNTLRDEAARAYANHEWEHNRESFERIPVPISTHPRAQSPSSAA